MNPAVLGQLAASEPITDRSLAEDENPDIPAEPGDVAGPAMLGCPVVNTIWPEEADITEPAELELLELAETTDSMSAMP